MSDYKYTYTVDQFPNEQCDLGKLDTEIRDSSIIVSLNYLSAVGDEIYIYFKASLNNEDWTTLSGVVATHDGESIEEPPVSVSVSNTPNVSLDEVKDVTSGKLRVHQTSRKQGLSIHWTGKGDNRANCNKFGNGNCAAYYHNIGDPMTETFYIDFNVINNETWVHEMILTWKDCMLDEVTAEFVSDYCTITSASGTSLTTYGSIVIPTYSGYGDIDIISDITTYSGGLVHTTEPSDPGVEMSPGFWDASWSTPINNFYNVLPNINGSGEYNLFHEEAILNRVINHICLLGSGFQILNSSDAEQIGHGIRLKVTFETKGEDHEWACSAIVVLHRDTVVDLS